MHVLTNKNFFQLKPLLRRLSFDVICCQPSDAKRMKGCCRYSSGGGLSVFAERSPHSRLSHVCYIKTSIGSLSMKSDPIRRLHRLAAHFSCFIFDLQLVPIYGIISPCSPVPNSLNLKGYGRIYFRFYVQH